MGFSASTNTTLLDIAKANGADAVVGLIDEAQKKTPEVALIPGRTIRGLSYKTWVRTGLPFGEVFRNANEGVAPSKSTYEDRQVDTFIFDPRIEVDKAVATGYEDGAAAWMAIEGDGAMKNAMLRLGRQFYYGRNQWTLNSTVYGGSQKGFPGLVDGYNRSLYELDAGGTTANTGTSASGVKYGPKYVQWVFGNGGEFTLSDIKEERILDGNGLPLTGLVQEILARPGLQIGSLRGVGRIKKITDDHPLTDTLLAQWIAQFELGEGPDLILMSRRARKQLQLSRPVVLQGGGAGKPNGGSATIAPIPTNYDEIPIEASDSILDNEPLTL